MMGIGATFGFLWMRRKLFHTEWAKYPAVGCLLAALLVAVGVYFVYCWVRAGQTLAMKSWRLRLVDRDGRLLRPGRAVLRYLLAWTLFAPGLLFIAATGAGGLSILLALAASVLAMLAFAGIGPRRQLLHDLLLGSRVIRE
jgi:uncharacterized RDD family membrane protein YckC